MEKIIVLLPIIIFFGFFGLLVLAFLLVLLKIILKTKKSEWHGEVIDKIYETRREDVKKFSHFYTLVVKTSDGQIRKVAVTKEMFDSCQIGDKLVKPKGFLNPRKVE
jgi:hypothetical protein